MYIKLIAILFITLNILSSNILAAPEDIQSVNAEPPTVLQNGSGWQTIRSIKMGKTDKYVHMVLIDQDKYTDKTIYSSAINRLCKKDADFCRIRFWSELRYIPEKITVTTQQYKQLKAEYVYNRKAGTRKLVWSCSVDPDKSHCLDL